MQQLTHTLVVCLLFFNLGSVNDSYFVTLEVPLVVTSQALLQALLLFWRSICVYLSQHLEKLFFRGYQKGCMSVFSVLHFSRYFCFVTKCS